MRQRLRVMIAGTRQVIIERRMCSAPKFADCRTVVRLGLSG
jgi:hypothetical protein